MPGSRSTLPTPAPPADALPTPRGQSKLSDRLREVLRARRYSRLSPVAQAGRTEQCYCPWACLPRREASRRRQVKRPILFRMIYTHVLNRGDIGVRSPADTL